MNFLLRIGLICFVLYITAIITCPFWCCFISDENYNILCTIFLSIPILAIIGAFLWCLDYYCKVQILCFDFSSFPNVFSK